MPNGPPATTLGKLLMCLCHQAVQFGTGQRAVMLCGREGNRRSGVTLAMRHRLQWFIHLRAHGQAKGDEHHLGIVRFTFTLCPWLCPHAAPTRQIS